MASEELIIDVVTALATTFRREMNRVTIQMYATALSDISDEALQLAFIACAKECKHFPSPAEIRERAGCESSEDRARKAWDLVEYASRIGAYRSVDFEDGLINASIRHLGGWETILSKSEDDFSTWVRKDFMAAYQSYESSGASPEACAMLRGIHPDKKPKRIMNNRTTVDRIGLPDSASASRPKLEIKKP